MDTPLTIIQIVQPFCAILAIWIGSDILVKNSLELGKKLGMSELLVGLTFVAWGTSLPEFFVMLNSIFLIDKSPETIKDYKKNRWTNKKGLGGSETLGYTRDISKVLMATEYLQYLN